MHLYFIALQTIQEPYDNIVLITIVHTLHFYCHVSHDVKFAFLLKISFTLLSCLTHFC